MLTLRLFKYILLYRMVMEAATPAGIARTEAVPVESVR